MNKLQERDNVKEFADYAATSELRKKTQREYEDLKQQSNNLRNQIRQDTDRRVKEQSDFNLLLQNTKEKSTQEISISKNSVQRLEKTLRDEADNISRRVKDLDNREIEFQKKEENLKQLGLLGEEGKRIVRDKNYVIQQKADLAKWELQLGNEQTRLTNQKKIQDNDRVTIEKLFAEGEGIKKNSSEKFSLAQSESSAASTMKTEAKRLNDENKALEKTLQADREQIVKIKEDNEKILDNVKKAREAFKPQLKEITDKQLQTKADVEEAREKYIKIEQMQEENRGMLSVLDGKRRAQEAKERELKTREEALLRKQLLLEGK